MTDASARGPSFIVKVLIVILLAALGIALWRASHVVLIAFAGILMAVALHNLAAALARRTHLPHRVAIAVTAIVLAVLAIGFLAAFGNSAAVQFTALIDQLPQAWAAARNWLQSWTLGRELLEHLDGAGATTTQTLLGALPVAGSVLGGLADIGLILVIGIYLAVDSQTYLEGALRLLPPVRRPRAREILLATGGDLRKWLIGMALDMLFLGTITGFGLWLVGVPLSFALGVLSGLSVFVPYIGPILSAAPGLLLALSVSPRLALFAAIVYVICQQLEGNISLPLLQRWTVSLPPVVSLLAIVAFGLLFGLWGVLLATPMAVAALTIIRMGYIEDVLEAKIARKGDGGRV